MQTLDQLNHQFGIANTLRFDTGNGGLTRVVITNDQAEAHIYLQGAHVTHFQPRGQKPVLFLSQAATFVPGKPIRGGVPICFPWFGPKEGLPMHGTARLQEWVVQSATPHSIQLRCVTAPWDAQFRVEIGAALTMTLEVRNTGNRTEQFEEALHTYLAVGDIRQVTVTGLENTEYLDNTVGLTRKQQDAQPICFTGETDRVYLNTPATCVAHDPVGQRQLIVEKKGSAATVVWNPWIAKAKAMADFGDDEWPGMLCIETANCKAHAVTLPAGQTHTLSATIRAA